MYRNSTFRTVPVDPRLTARPVSPLRALVLLVVTNLAAGFVGQAVLAWSGSENLGALTTGSLELACAAAVAHVQRVPLRCAIRAREPRTTSAVRVCVLALLLFAMDASDPFRITGVGRAVATDPSAPNFTSGAWITLVCLVAPIFEEVLSTGLLFPSLVGKLGKPAALLMSAGLFSVLHLPHDVGLAFEKFTFGAASISLYLRFDCLAPCIALHALHNGLVIVAMQSAGLTAALTACQSELPVAWLVALAGVVVLIAVNVRHARRLPAQAPGRRAQVL